MPPLKMTIRNKVRHGKHPGGDLSAGVAPEITELSSGRSGTRAATAELRAGVSSNRCFQLSGYCRL
jgi:hypothetical protein